MIEPTQADKDAAKSILWVETLIDDELAIIQAFAARRQAGMIEGARLAIEAAAATVASCMFNSHGREQPELVKAIRALNPAQIVGDVI